MVQPTLRILTRLDGEDRRPTYFQSYGDSPYFFQCYAILFRPILAKGPRRPLILFQSYAGRYTERAISVRASHQPGERVEHQSAQARHRAASG